MRLDPTKPVEELIGDNRGIVRMILGNVHCAQPLSEAARTVYAKLHGKARQATGQTLREALRTYPRPLRRGLVLCIVETLREYTADYRAVCSGRVAQTDDHADELAEIVADCPAAAGL